MRKHGGLRGLLRSIRRRLVTGFTVALVLLLLMSVAAIWGLIRHQAAIAELDELVNRSPDRGRLLAAVSLVQRPLNARLDLSKPEAVSWIRTEFEKAVREAQKEAEVSSAGLTNGSGLCRTSSENAIR